jgi:hypothetical protein
MVIPLKNRASNPVVGRALGVAWEWVKNFPEQGWAGISGIPAGETRRAFTFLDPILKDEESSVE